MDFELYASFEQLYYQTSQVISVKNTKEAEFWRKQVTNTLVGLSEDQWLQLLTKLEELKDGA